MSQVEKYVDNEEDLQDEKSGDEEDLVAVEEQPETGDEPDADADAGEDDEEESEEETRLGGNRADDNAEKKAARQNDNKTRRQRQREARERSGRELRYLEKRNEALERRFSALEQDIDQRVTGNEVAHVTGAINKAKSDLQLANQVIQQAVEQNDGKNLAEALDHRDAIRDNLRDLNEAHSYLTQRDNRVATQQPQQLDPRHIAHAQKFMVENSWWDPRGGDGDSQEVLRIDRTLVQEGYDPVSKEYWDELRSRVKDAVPTRFETRTRRGNDEDDDGQPTNGKPKARQNKGPQFRTGGRERPLKKNEVYISPERKDAMVEAGVWDDPVLRNKYLKAYSKYDNEQRGNTGA